MAPSANSPGARRHSGAMPPPLIANGIRTSAASAVRVKTTPAGERSSRPILMNRYDAPQSAASTSSRIQLRLSTYVLLADGGLCHQQPLLGSGGSDANGSRAEVVVGQRGGDQRD